MNTNICNVLFKKSRNDIPSKMTSKDKKIDDEDIVKGFVSSIRYFEDNDSEKMKMAIERALKECESADNYFNNVSDPELIEYAIYNQRAAEEKYTYLIKRAKEIKLVK